MRASAACRLPTCLCSSPARERTKTSYRGQSGVMVSLVVGGLGGRGGAVLHLLGVRGGGLAHPLSGGVRGTARLQALAVARPVALEHRVELAPVDGPDAVVTGGLVQVQLRVRDGKAEEVRLRHRDVDE